MQVLSGLLVFCMMYEAHFQAKQWEYGPNDFDAGEYLHGTYSEVIVFSSCVPFCVFVKFKHDERTLMFDFFAHVF